MRFTSDLFEIRFGCGLSPVVAPPTDLAGALDGLMAPDVMAQEFPIDGFDTFMERLGEVRQLNARRAKATNTEDRDALRMRITEFNQSGARQVTTWAARHFLRCAHTPTGFRERLVAFWADHFTARGKGGFIRFTNSAYVETAIRPHISGYFSDLLFAAATHPLMLNFLDQDRSVGPQSVAATRSKRDLGLNENLAREVMELHTLGVAGSYTQTDVRELAELFTGLTFKPDRGRFVQKRFSEPGAETVMGTQYDATPSLENVRQVLHDLAQHPETASHIARKLAVHFVSDQPSEALVSHVAQRYLETDGALMPVYAAMLEHPDAWGTPLQNVKPPVDFMASAFRALSIPPEPIEAMRHGRARGLLLLPLELMGQPWREPNGPDGWPEEDEAWVTPQNLAVRLRWAMDAPRFFQPNLPEPADFVTDALGRFAPGPVHFAASAAESRREAIGLVLCSPAFQRR